MKRMPERRKDTLNVFGSKMMVAPAKGKSLTFHPKLYLNYNVVLCLKMCERSQK